MKVIQFNKILIDQSLIKNLVLINNMKKYLIDLMKNYLLNMMMNVMYKIT